MAKSNCLCASRAKYFCFAARAEQQSTYGKVCHAFRQFTFSCGQFQSGRVAAKGILSRGIASEHLPGISHGGHASAHIEEVNALALGQLISLWKQDRHKLYQEVLTSDPLYIQGIARHLTTSAHNQSNLRPSELESSISEVLSLQLTELKQLDETGSFGENGLTELLFGQIEHLSGQAADWVWSTNQLTELLGSKPAPVQDISLEATMQEFNQMVHQAQPNEHDAIATVVESQSIPTWSNLLAPLVALAILLFLYCSYSQLIAI